MKKVSILDYIDHIEEPEFFAALLSQFALPTIIDNLILILQTAEEEKIGIACLFIRDFALIAPKHSKSIPLREILVSSPVINAVERLLLSTNLRIRINAAYTLGKIGSTTSLPILYTTFQTRKETDPLFINQLLLEILWLEETKSWYLIRELAHSKSFLSRWAALDVLNVWSGGSDYAKVKIEILQLLKQDGNTYVRQQAEYGWQQMEHILQSANLPKQAKTRKQRIKFIQPQMTFSDIEIWFGNKLRQQHVEDYTVQMLIDFIETEAQDMVHERELFQRKNKGTSIKS